MDDLIAARLRAGLNAGGAECPEAEILAAFVERTLTPRERTNFENHLASCARCQEGVAGLVRLSEADPATGIRAAAAARAARPFAFQWAWAGTALAVMLLAGIWITDEYQTGLRQREAARIQAPQPLPKEPAAPPVQAGKVKPSAQEKEIATLNKVHHETQSQRRQAGAAGAGALDLTAGAPTSDLSQAKAKSDLAVAPKPSPPPEISKQAVQARAPMMPSSASGRQFSNAHAEVSGNVTKNRVALSAPAASIALAKAENAPSPPPPPAPTATLAVQPDREANRPELEARADQLKAAKLAPAARSAAQRLGRHSQRHGHGFHWCGSSKCEGHRERRQRQCCYGGYHE